MNRLPIDPPSSRLGAGHRCPRTPRRRHCIPCSALAIGPLLALIALGPSASPAVAHLSIIRQGPDSRGVPESGDIFGSALATGDFNGDGIDDLATGAPGEDLGAVESAGAVVINWGTPFGLTHVGASIFTADTFDTATPNEQFGYALAAGDFNNDGYDDLAVGAPGYAIAGIGTDIGRVCLLRGTPSGLVVWHTLFQSHLGTANEAGDRFGETLCAGNLDGETGAGIRDDLAIGSPGENDAAGVVHWVRGTSGGLFGPSGWFMATSLGWLASPGDRFGASLAIGNLIGDTINDLAVGHPFEDYFTQNDVGRVHIIPGAAGGPTATGATSVIAANTDAVTSGGWFGLSIGIGRFGNEPASYASLSVGEPRWSSSTVSRAGRVHVFHGGATELSPTGYIHELAVGGGGVFPDDRFGWRVAVGKFDGDLFDDLVVGCPYDRWTGAEFQAGKVYISYGGTNGVGNHGWANFNQATLNDAVEDSELLGATLAIGDFDSSNRGAIAVAAPGEDNLAGQVHIIAPWRQVYDLSCRHSVVVDCDGNLIFSQKARDEVWIASTTKIMTVLLGCEAAQAGEVGLDAVFDIPTWVVDDVGGSQVPLLPGERMSLRNLLITCLALSGNDAAHAIANIVEGELGAFLSLPAFVARMNDRAAALGMTGTHFHNPAGLDVVPVGPAIGDHHSTAIDMAILGQAAMDNDLFREIVGTTTLSIERQGHLFGAPWSMDWATASFFAWIIDNPYYPDGTGIKGGWTPNAQSTGVFSASGSGGDAVSGTFYTPQSAPVGAYGNDAVALLNLGLATCGEAIPYEPVPDGIHLDRGLLSTFLDDLSGGGAQISAQDNDPVAIDFVRSAGSGSTAARLAVTHISEVLFDRSSTVEFGISPFEAHDGLTLINMGETSSTLFIIPSYGDTFAAEVPAGGRFEIPAYGGPDAAGITIRLQSGETLPVHFTVEEHYRFDRAFDDEAGVQFSAWLRRPGSAGDVVDLVVRGQDPIAGSTLAAFVRDGDTVLGTPPGEPIVPEEGAVRVPSAAPNPFTAGTRITFRLSMPTAVQVRIHDVAGRRIRTFDESELRAGSWSVHWNGADDRGIPVADGVYFYEIAVDGHASTVGKVVRRR